jgi:arsenite methyltransferase
VQGDSGVPEMLTRESSGVLSSAQAAYTMNVDGKRQSKSNTDMAGNSAGATEHNLQLEGVAQFCTLVSKPAQEMPFKNSSFDLVVSNLCLHNISDRSTRRRAIEQIARVLKFGGTAILSDYKLTGEYATQLRELGFSVEKRRGSFVTTFPPLTVIVAHKPA